MTHDELFALLNSKSDSDEIHALRAVVELHKPETGWVDGVEVENHHCSCDPYNEYDMGYPCETIQAIEEQLK
jgi:hypothetical protein